MEIVRSLLFLLIGFGSTAILFCTAIGLFLIMSRPNSLYAILLLSSRDISKFFFARVFWICAAIGVFVCVGFGAHALLFWMPKSFGSYADGEWTPLRDSIALMLGFCGGFGFLQFLSNVLPLVIYGKINSSSDQLNREFLHARLEDQQKRRRALITLKSKLNAELSKVNDKITALSRKSKTYAEIFDGTRLDTRGVYYAFPAVRYQQDLSELLKSVESELATI